MWLQTVKRIQRRITAFGSAPWSITDISTFQDAHQASEQSNMSRVNPSPTPSLTLQLFRLPRAAALLIPWLTHLLVADILLSALLPLAAFLPTTAYNLSSQIAASVWRSIQSIFTRSNHAQIIVSGADALPRSGESAIVVSNHVDWVDFYMINELGWRTGMLGRCRYFAKRQLKWVPFLGWGLWAMGMPLVSRDWTSDRREMDRIFHGVLERKWPMCKSCDDAALRDAVAGMTWISFVARQLLGLISYSEGTRYTATKRLETEAWVRQHPPRRLGANLLYPRTKGFVASVQKLRSAPQVRAVYDLTIAYARNHDGAFQQAPTFLQTVMNPCIGEDYRFYVHVDRHAMEDLPQEDGDLATWLEERWVQKGERLEGLRQSLNQGKPWVTK